MGRAAIEGADRNDVEEARVVRPSFFSGDDRALLEALKRGDPGASLALYDRFAPHLRRVLARVMGVDNELPELLHDTFVAALGSLDGLRDESCLKAWLTRIAVFTARGCIRRRRRRRWLEFRAPEAVDELPVSRARTEDALALHRTYDVLSRLDVDERIVFTLRYLEQMTVDETADACGVSPATVKRRLAKAEERFSTLAREDPVLRTWVEESPRWRER